jgi:hypothetical protein
VEIWYILTSTAGARGGALGASLEALAVLLEATGLVALAALFLCFSLHSRFERQREREKEGERRD